jgi:hydroxyacylglutathione hydrolase
VVTLIFEVFPAGVFQANCFIIGDKNTKDGAIIDPGGNVKGIMEEVKELGLNIKYIILTHGHGDHIAAVAGIKEETGAKILINQKDEYLVKGATLDLIPILRNMKLFEVDGYISEGDILKLGEMEVHVFETPGHTPGSVSLKIGDKIITGDAVFRGSIGRTDFEFGSQEQLIESIKDKILTLSDEVAIFPGHGPSTTVGAERKHNPFLK